ncbi:MAG TPA: hypothetical protein VF466_03070 [Candidatus Saccharimonadales bacterium]
MKQLLRRAVVMAAALTIIGSSMGLALPALTQRALAAGCVGPSIMFGRWKWCGYFYNRFQDQGGPVRAAGVPGGVNTAQSFINLVEGDYFSGDTQKITEAVFIVREMIGDPLPTPPCGLGACKSVTGAELTEFENRVKSYASNGENGSQSFGPNGHIDWYHSDYMHCGDYNSYYQPAFHDIAPYIITSSNTPECNNGGIQFDHIFFYNSAGGVIWRIRRLCMNPLGSLSPLAPAPPPFSLSVNITPKSNGAALVSGSYVQPGDNVTFDYDVINGNAGTGTGISCQAHANDKAGWVATPAPETTGPNPGGVACTSTFGPGDTHLGTETVASAPTDTSLCRSLIVSPASPSGGTAQIEVCVYVSSRPYYRVYGGDVSAGNPQSNACGTVTHAGIVSWSKDLTGYAGAGAQYGELALDKIYESASNLGNAAGPAAAPSGLTFANTGAGGSTFGGDYGALPCLTDFYASATGTPFGGGNLTPLGTGSYKATGPINISGNINPGNRIILYVNGNVTISGNIDFPGNWSVNNMPYLQVVASGNIYIDKGVSTIGGIFIAQGTGGAGTIYTCTNGATPYTVDATGSFNTACHSKLTINGAFIANQVQLLRTNGTVKQSNVPVDNAANQAEVFNYSPALWIPQPPNAPTQGKYDAITSLPPIL